MQKRRGSQGAGVQSRHETHRRSRNADKTNDTPPALPRGPSAAGVACEHALIKISAKSALSTPGDMAFTIKFDSRGYTASDAHLVTPARLGLEQSLVRAAHRLGQVLQRKISAARRRRGHGRRCSGSLMPSTAQRSFSATFSASGSVVWGRRDQKLLAAPAE